MGGACEGDAECAGGNCVDGLCTRGCGDQSPCLAGWTCGAAGVCELPAVGGACVEASECAGGICQAGACTRGCNATTPCPAGYTCGAGGAGGACVALPEAAEATDGCGGAPQPGSLGLSAWAALLALAGLILVPRRRS
jgi:hypothetical protein